MQANKRGSRGKASARTRLQELVALGYVRHPGGHSKSKENLTRKVIGILLSLGFLG
jgi:hypothetical protein